MFILCAFVFDLYKWCIFLLATETCIDDGISSKNKMYRSKSKMLQFVLIGVQIFVVLLSLTFSAIMLMASEESDLYNQIDDAQSYFNVISFSLFLIFYCVILRQLTTRLKTYYTKFYEREGRTIWISNISIIVSIIARIFFNLIVTFDAVMDKLDESLQQGTWLYPMYHLISSMLGTILPIASIIYSLMYGITHKSSTIDPSLSQV